MMFTQTVPSSGWRSLSSKCITAVFAYLSMRALHEYTNRCSDCEPDLGTIDCFGESLSGVLGRRELEAKAVCCLLQGGLPAGLVASQDPRASGFMQMPSSYLGMGSAAGAAPGPGMQSLMPPGAAMNYGMPSDYGQQAVMGGAEGMMHAFRGDAGMMGGAGPSNAAIGSTARLMRAAGKGGGPGALERPVYCCRDARSSLLHTHPVQQSHGAYVFQDGPPVS